MLNNLIWDKKTLYRPYGEWKNSYYQSLIKKAKSSSWRANYHIEPPSGLLNDPNGFTFFNDSWQLSYQHFPFGPTHGLKSWHHLTSSDLIHWTDQGTLLEPNSKFDAQGVYSGSAIPISHQQLLIMYTGNVRDKNWKRHSYQNGAILDSNNQLTKISTPLIKNSKFVTEHFRDPMLFKYKSELYALIGAQDLNINGIMLIYKNEETLQNWRLSGKIQIYDTKFGYMVECPNLVFVDKCPLLIFSPQGLSHKILTYKNNYPTVYSFGTDFDSKNFKINNPSPLKLLDEGFDGYATQAINAPDGRVLSISWIGLPETPYPTDDYQYQGALTLVRTLSIKNNQLYQYPVEETASLRVGSLKSVEGKINTHNNQYELTVCVEAGKQKTLHLFANQKNNQFLLIKIDSKHGTVVIDRTKYEWQKKTDGVRTITVAPNKLIEITVFVDVSIFECYINKGAHVATGRVFPKTTATWIIESENHTAKFWNLKKEIS